MNNDFLKFEELLKTDKTVKDKLKSTLASYNGDPSTDSIFENIILPLAKDAGLTVSAEDYKNYLENVNNTHDLTEEELQAVSGGSKDGWNTFIDIISGGMVE